MNEPPDESLILPLDSPGAALERVGGKGASLARLVSAGLPVPPGFHVTTLAYRRFVSANRLAEPILAAAARARADDTATLDGASAEIREFFARGTMPDDLAAAIRRAYAELGPDDPPVAVRSSATAEDLPGMSFAGQQETYLNVRGGEPVLKAVRRCWASLWTARALGYRARQGIPADAVALAVVVQQLVAADVAGILFTANPLTGARDEATINAAWGLGEAIVGSQVTPDTFVVNKQTGAIGSQEIADKEVMTVRLPEGTREEPVPADRRKLPSLQPPQAAELARVGTQIEKLYGVPMDVEWALRDGRFFLLQARPITALPEPAAALDWKLPDARGKYFRASVIELLPDPLSPLFATLALPCLNEAYRGLGQVTGLAGVMSGNYLLTINDYAYYDYSRIGGWQLLWALPRFIPTAVRWLRRAQVRWAEEARPRYAALVGTWAGRDLASAPAVQLRDGTRAIVKEAADHYLTIQSGILPVAALSELLFTQWYNRLVKRRSDPPVLTFLLGFDSAPIRAEKSLYDIATWARTRPALADYLTRATGEEIAARCAAPGAPIADADSWRAFAGRVAEHLHRFGHAVYDLDFAKPVSAEQPGPLLDTLKHFLAGQARSPYERQGTAEAAREEATQQLLGRLSGWRLRWTQALLRWAQRYGPLREDALADVGLGWPLLRRMFHEIARRLVAAGALARPEDVFWLKAEEVVAAARALDATQPPPDFRGAMAERRATWERERRVTPPVVLPVKGGARLFGVDWSRWMPAQTDQAAGDVIRGVGASPGRVAGPARVLHGPAEFSQMRQGDILVAKITTPAWTPLFALASGVVTDVGGLLSHSSIVAREYHIPAVLGTGVATDRIRSGQRITVDGDGGVVRVG
jgi:pyruvate,water dikinase